MKMRHFAAAIAVVASLCSPPVMASAPSCHTYSGQGYCQYTGRAYQVYINSSNQIILYFDAPMEANAPTSVGIAGVTTFGAAMYLLSENPDYGKMLYASLLTAQARGATVTVQLWGVTAGYMKIDRIWVHE
ncbi:MAG TPA: hypothetical protein VFU13_17230 [Steroidobacteraceae bacterium]|nr:hypothetical protein [Steroidobacteraceae bacterium]